VIDIFTKWIWTKALPTKDKGPVADFIETLPVFHIYHSDNGGEFRNGELSQLIESLGSKEVHGRPRHPQSQGHVERVNSSLKEKLKSLTKFDDEWAHLLDRGTKAYNYAFHSTIKMSPYFAEFGIDPPQLALGPGSKWQARLPMTNSVAVERDELNKIVKERLQKAADKRTLKWNRSARVVTYQVGEFVFIRKEKKTDKKDPRRYRWRGIVSKVARNHTYRVTWIGQGPLQQDLDKTESRRYLPSRLMRKIRQPEKIFGDDIENVFNIPAIVAASNSVGTSSDDHHHNQSSGGKFSILFLY
jgi:hypothetical protein